MTVCSSTILVGDVRERLAEIPDRSVQTCVTSPPYWGLRDYGVDGQIGLEETPELFVNEMVAVFRDVARVLADDGTLWLNLGDSYKPSSGSTKDGFNERYFGKTFASDKQGHASNHLDRRRFVANGIKPKDLCGIPWRVAFALQSDGWYLRSDIIWHKPNPMPESVRDRPTKAHEYVFLLSRSPRYVYDAAAIEEPARWERWGDQTEVKSHPGGGRFLGGKTIAELPVRDTKNRRTVWTIPKRGYRGAHFAVMPEALVEPCILAGSRLGDTVLDPFAGAGTVGVVALRHGRNFVGIELNPEYAEMARNRIAADAPLLNEAVAT